VIGIFIHRHGLKIFGAVGITEAFHKGGGAGFLLGCLFTGNLLRHGNNLKAKRRRQNRSRNISERQDEDKSGVTIKLA
jgi:hypothetical protein